MVRLVVVVVVGFIHEPTTFPSLSLPLPLSIPRSIFHIHSSFKGKKLSSLGLVGVGSCLIFFFFIIFSSSCDGGGGGSSGGEGDVTHKSPSIHT